MRWPPWGMLFSAQTQSGSYAFTQKLKKWNLPLCCKMNQNRNMIQELEIISFGGGNPLKYLLHVHVLKLTILQTVHGSCYKLGPVILIKLLASLQRPVLKNPSISCDRQVSIGSGWHPLTIDVEILGVLSREASDKALSLVHEQCCPSQPWLLPMSETVLSS